MTVAAQDIDVINLDLNINRGALILTASAAIPNTGAFIGDYR